MEEVSRGQALQVAGRVAMQVRWDDINGDRLQRDVLELSSEEFGKRFTDFLKNGARMIIGDPRFVPTKPFDPAEFLGSGWTIWRGPIDGDGLSGEEDVDLRSGTLPEVELSKIIFETCLQAGENSITGEEKLRQLKKKPEFIRFGGNVFLGLWLDYQANKENSVLEWIYRNFKISYLDFFGLILRGPLGDRRVLVLNRNDDGKWYWYCPWLGTQWVASGPSVVGCAS